MVESKGRWGNEVCRERQECGGGDHTTEIWEHRIKKCIVKTTAVVLKLVGSSEPHQFHSFFFFSIQDIVMFYWCTK